MTSDTVRELASEDRGQHVQSQTSGPQQLEIFLLLTGQTSAVDPVKLTGTLDMGQS